MVRCFFASILFFVLPRVLDAQDLACNQWFNNVCLSFCSDAQGLTGTSGLTCFRASNTSLENPARIITCFNAPAEQAGRMPQVLLCLPQRLCTAGITVYKLVGNNFQPVLRNSSIYLGDNRDTPCDLCEDPNHYLTLHDNYTNLIGRYYAQLSYQCCGAEPISFAFYYEIVDGVSSADMTLGYTASTQIENLNGDPIIDGYLPCNGAVPGPALGPFSSGVRLTSPSGSIGGPSQYTVSLYSITCGYVGNGTLLHTSTVPVAPNTPFEYKFNKIPNWSNIFEPNGCYKVIVSGQGTCGTITKTGFFSLTSECISCRPSQNNRRGSNANLGAADDTCVPPPISVSLCQSATTSSVVTTIASPTVAAASWQLYKAKNCNDGAVPGNIKGAPIPINWIVAGSGFALPNNSGCYILQYVFSKPGCPSQIVRTLLNTDLDYIQPCDDEARPVNTGNNTNVVVDAASLDNDGAEAMAHSATPTQDLVFSNPASGMVYFAQAIPSGVIRLYTIQGNLVKSVQMQNSYQLDVSDVVSGQYILALQTAGRVVSKRLLVLAAKN